MKQLMSTTASSMEEKRVFLIATPQADRAQWYTALIQKHVSHATVFVASDGVDAIFKIDNFPPHIVIVDMFLPKRSGIDITDEILKNEKLQKTAVIIPSEVPDSQHFVDQVVTGRVQFLIDNQKDEAFVGAITKALNFVSQGATQSYKLRFLTANDFLFKEGDEAHSVFIVKTGRLQAFRGSLEKPVILGPVLQGEFVGEMAHFNGEARSASVVALTDCELIEIPRGALDMVLFTKPAWSKALFTTLSRRLKHTNSAL